MILLPIVLILIFAYNFSKFYKESKTEELEHEINNVNGNESERIIAAILHNTETIKCEQRRTRNNIGLACVFIAILFVVFAIFLVKLPDIRFHYKISTLENINFEQD